MVHQQVFKLDELYFPHLTWHDLPSSQICVSVSPQTISDKPIHHAYLHNSTQSHSITHHLSFLDLINKNPQRPSPPTTWQPWPWADLPTWPDCLWVYGFVCVCINLIVFCMSGHTHKNCWLCVCMWECGMRGSKGAPGCTTSAEKISLPLVCYLSLLIHLSPFWDIYLHLHPHLQWSLAESEMGPQHSSRQDGKEVTFNLAYHMHTHAHAHPRTTYYNFLFL